VRQSSTLSPQRRPADIARLAGSPLDVLVVGGGVTGAGAALDAASRGLSVGLVEAQDWAAGTSSRSSKLVHGGLRYLQMLDFRLVREALRERSLLLQHLRPISYGRCPSSTHCGARSWSVRTSVQGWRCTTSWASRWATAAVFPAPAPEQARCPLIGAGARPEGTQRGRPLLRRPGR